MNGFHLFESADAGLDDRGTVTEVDFVDPQVIPFQAPGAHGVVTVRKP